MKYVDDLRERIQSLRIKREHLVSEMGVTKLTPDRESSEADFQAAKVELRAVDLSLRVRRLMLRL